MNEVFEARMAELKSAINDAITEAEDYADKHNLGFNLCPAYGMGGYYDGEEGGWHPSSEGC